MTRRIISQIAQLLTLSVLQAFHPSAQAAFHKALTEVDATAATATSTNLAIVPPDAAVAFRLYRDSGRLVNLADWWSAFEQAAVDEEAGDGGEATATKGASAKRKPGGSDNGMEVDGVEEDAEGDEDEDDNPRRRKQARFLRAVADLAHAGYVQPSSRKAEHVSKTIF